MDSVVVDAQSVTQEGRVAYVAVESSRGPHVTPFLYAPSGGHLWFLGAADTVTVRLTDPITSAGVLVRAGAGDVVLTGTLRRLDALRLADAVREGRGLFRTPGALVRYGMRNAPDLLAFGRDALRGSVGRLPPTRRVLLAFAPTREFVVDGTTVTSAPRPLRPPAATTAGAPQRVSDPDAASVSAVLAVRTDDGPIAVPVHWDADEQRGWISGPLADATHLRAGVGAVAFDAYGAPGPAAKSGRMVRGAVELVDSDGSWREFRLLAERVTRWSGVDTETRQLA